MKSIFLNFLFGKERAPHANGQFTKVNINLQHHLMYIFPPKKILKIKMFFLFCTFTYFKTEVLFSESQRNLPDFCKVSLEIQILIFCFISTAYAYTWQEAENPRGLIRYSIVLITPQHNFTF